MSFKVGDKVQFPDPSSGSYNEYGTYFKHWCNERATGVVVETYEVYPKVVIGIKLDAPWNAAHKAVVYFYSKDMISFANRPKNYSADMVGTYAKSRR